MADGSNFSSASRSANYRNPTPISGWALNPIVAIDEAAPGFLRAMCMASPATRHAVFYAFGEGVFDAPDLFLERLTGAALSDGASWTDALRSLAVAFLQKPRDIIEAASGEPMPVGLIGALKKAGPNALLDESYASLWSLCSDPRYRHQKRALMQLRRVDDVMLEVLTILPAAVCHPNFVVRVRHPSVAKQVRDIIMLAVEFRSDLDVKTLWRSAASIEPKTSIQKWLRGLLGGFDRIAVPPPTIGDGELEWVSTGARLKVLGREMHNCLANKVVDVMSGRAFFYFHAATKTISMVNRFTDGSCWLTRIYSDSNFDVSDEVREVLHTKFEMLGVQIVTRVGASPKFGEAQKLFDSGWDEDLYTELMAA